MNVKVEKLSQCKVQLTVTCTKEAFNEALEYSLKENLKNVEVKGFRKGHCPRNVYLQKFGEVSLYEKAIDKCLNDSYFEACKENKLFPLSQPSIDFDYETIGRDKEFTYTATVEIYPDITLGEYKGVEVTKASTKVSEEEVNNYINNVLGQKAELSVVEGRTLQNGDTAVFDFEGFVDGVAFDGGKAENYELEIGSGQFIPGYEEQMVGMASEEERDINVTFPENYGAENLAGKPAVFKVKLHEIKEKVLPELNDEFVEELEIEDVKTVESYKAHVLNKLETEKTNNAENKLVDDLLDKICEDAIVDVPETLVNEEVESYMARYTEQAKAYGLTLEQLLSFQGATVDSFKASLTESSKKKVLIDLVVYKISQVEQITPSDEDIENEFVKLASDYKMDLQEAKKQVSKDNLVAYLQKIKTVDFLKENAKVIEA